MFLFESNLTNETVSVGFEHCQFDDVLVFVMIFRYSSELQLWTSHIYEPRDLSQEIHHFSYQKPFTITNIIIIQPLAVPMVGPRPRYPSRRSRATPRESHPRRIGGATTAGGRGAPQNSGFPNTQWIRTILGKVKCDSEPYEIQKMRFETIKFLAYPIRHTCPEVLWKFCGVKVKMINENSLTAWFFRPWWIHKIHQGTNLARWGGWRDLWQPTRSDWTTVEMMSFSFRDYNLWYI